MGGVALAQRLPGGLANLHWQETQTSRRAFAKKLVGEIAALEAEIPTLSPSEEAWLKVEYDDEVAQGRSGSMRAMNAFWSKEGLSRSAKADIRSFLLVLERLASPTTLSEREEVALWGKVAAVEVDQFVWSHILGLGDFKVLSRSPGASKIDVGYGELYIQVWAIRGGQILNDVVLPYLDKR